MFARTLLPTDFSPPAEQVAACLREMKALGTEEVALLNVIDLGPQIGFASDTFETMLAWKQDTEAKFNDLKSAVEATGLRVHWRIELGKPAIEIVRVAAEERVDLIAMGTHSHGFLRGALHGSVSREVIRNASVPVLALNVATLAPVGTTDCAFLRQHIVRRVLLPTDFSDCADQALAQLKQLSTAGVSEVVVLHVRESRKRGHEQSELVIQAKMEQIRSQLEFFGFGVTSIVLDGDPATIIDGVARERDVSLIVIGSHGRSAAEAGRLGSVADALISRRVRPVLVVRPVRATILV